MEKGEILYLKYQVQLDKKAYADTNENKRTNTATVQAGEADPQSDTGKIDINKTWVQKRGKFNNDGTIHWTIMINQGDKLDISGSQLKDTLLNGQTYVDGTLKFQKSDDAGKTFLDAGFPISWEELSQGTFVFPEGSNSMYKIEYDTTLPETAKIGEVIENKIEIIPQGSGSKSEVGKVTIGVGKDYIDKECLTESGTSTTVTWRVTVRIPAGTINRFNIDDRLPENSEYVEGSYREISDPNNLVGDPQIKNYKNEGSGINQRRVYCFDFGTVTSDTGGELIYEVQTHFIDDVIPPAKEPAVFWNDVWAKNDMVDLNNDSAKYTVIRNMKKKSNGSEDGGILKWKLEVSKLAADVQSVTIKDLLPANTQYVEDSIEVFKGNAKLSSDAVSASEADGALMIEFHDSALAAGKQKGLTVYYSIKITSQTEKNHTYTNRAHITIDGIDYPEVESSNTYELKDIIDKNYVYSRDTAPYVNYTVNVNPQAMDLDTRSDTVVLKDTFGEALSFIPGTLKVGDEIWSDYDYDTQTRVLTIRIPDGKSNTVTYSAMVSIQAGQSFSDVNGSNTCELVGTGYLGTSDAVALKGEVLRAWGDATSNSVKMDIYKYGDSISQLLEGAEFDICSIPVRENKADLESAVLVKTCSTDASEGKAAGSASITGLARDTLYKLVEKRLLRIIRSIRHQDISFLKEIIIWTGRR